MVQDTVIQYAGVRLKFLRGDGVYVRTRDDFEDPTSPEWVAVVKASLRPAHSRVQVGTKS